MISASARELRSVVAQRFRGRTRSPYALNLPFRMLWRGVLWLLLLLSCLPVVLLPLVTAVAPALTETLSTIAAIGFATTLFLGALTTLWQSEIPLLPPPLIEERVE